MRYGKAVTTVLAFRYILIILLYNQSVYFHPKNLYRNSLALHSRMLTGNCVNEFFFFYTASRGPTWHLTIVPFNSLTNFSTFSKSYISLTLSHISLVLTRQALLKATFDKDNTRYNLCITCSPCSLRAVSNSAQRHRE